VVRRYSVLFQIGPLAHPGCYKIGTGFYFRWLSGQGMSSTTHLLLTPRLNEDYSCSSSSPVELHGLFQGQPQLFFLLPRLYVIFIRFTGSDIVDVQMSNGLHARLRRQTAGAVEDWLSGIFDATRC
jgi:hypothetical protein